MDRVTRPRFVSEGHSMRTRIGSAGLVGVGGVVVASASRVGPLRHRVTRWWAAAARQFLRLDLDVEGLEHVDPSEQYVVAPLHEGFADALVLFGLPLDLRFTVRDELAEWPHLGRYLRWSDQLVVPTGGSVAMLRWLYRGAAETFGRGESLVVFPQGSILGIEAAFQPGAFRLAERLGRPLLPVVVTGTHLVWEHPYSPTVRYDQRVSVRVLEPVSPTEVGTRAREIELEMKRIAVGEGMAPVRHFVPERDGWWDGYDYEIDERHPELRERLARHRADAARRQ